MSIMDPTPPQLPPISAVSHLTTAANISQPPPSHPPYPEMIMAAIECGNSEEREIAMYIHRVYTHLPPTHLSELTHHLERLTNSGQLVLIKHSYHLPYSVRSTNADFPGAGAGTGLENGSGLVKRGRGRPRKVLRPGSGLENGGKRGRGRPWKVYGLCLGQAQAQGNEVTVPGSGTSAGLGNGSSLVKRRVGRPRREIGPDLAHAQAQTQTQGQEVINPGSGAGLENGTSLVKRRVGRPRKEIGPSLAQAEADEVMVPHSGLENDLIKVKREIGWPQTEIEPGLADAQAHEVMVPGSGLENGSSLVKRARGRPRKDSWSALAQAQDRARAQALRNALSLEIRGRLRPRKENGPGSIPAQTQPRESGVRSGKRGRGRPRKEMNPTFERFAQVEAANEELRTMLEEMQSKLKVAVGVIRPHIATQSAPDAGAALQQLEQLSTMKPTTSPSLNAPPETSLPIDMTAQLQSTSAPDGLGASSFAAPPGIPLPFGMNVPPVTPSDPSSNCCMSVIYDYY
ncbi:hypothetical protein RND81_02G115700 [Saponaria officinalis]|uniref:H15 domain-containing protein n=1 Tax=Saponaria officinalis TaxID=3572 RepID=A0AAW1MLF9_SAPOF